jgi:hypothetical protein
MKQKRAFLFLGLTVVLLLTLVLTNWGIMHATECRIVRLHGEVYPSMDLQIEPTVLRVQKGTCVIWLNWVKTGEVRIVFEDGKKCEDMTDSPIGFKLDAANCYVTTFVSRGETSSLMFSEPGTYDYVIKTSGAEGAEEVQGKVIVQ